MKKLENKIAQFVESLDPNDLGFDGECILLYAGEMASTNVLTNRDNCTNKAYYCSGSHNAGRCTNSKKHCHRSINADKCK